jgi:hypothetical protein
MAMNLVCAVPTRAMVAAPRTRYEQKPQGARQLRATPVAKLSARLARPVTSSKRLQVTLVTLAPV